MIPYVVLFAIVESNEKGHNAKVNLLILDLKGYMNVGN